MSWLHIFRLTIEMPPVKPMADPAAFLFFPLRRRLNLIIQRRAFNKETEIARGDKEVIADLQL